MKFLEDLKKETENLIKIILEKINDKKIRKEKLFELKLLWQKNYNFVRENYFDETRIKIPNFDEMEILMEKLLFVHFYCGKEEESRKMDENFSELEKDENFNELKKNGNFNESEKLKSFNELEKVENFSDSEKLKSFNESLKNENFKKFKQHFLKNPSDELKKLKKNFDKKKKILKFLKRNSFNKIHIILKKYNQEKIEFYLRILKFLKLFLKELECWNEKSHFKLFKNLESIKFEQNENHFELFELMVKGFEIECFGDLDSYYESNNDQLGFENNELKNNNLESKNNSLEIRNNLEINNNLESKNNSFEIKNNLESKNSDLELKNEFKLKIENLIKFYKSKLEKILNHFFQKKLEIPNIDPLKILFKIGTQTMSKNKIYNENHTQIICPILKVACTKNNKPNILKCSHVISRNAIIGIGSGNVKCPYCPEISKMEEIREIFYD